MEDNETRAIPTITINNETYKVPPTDIYYIDSPYTSTTITNILSVNIQDETNDVKAEVFILGDPSIIYVSMDNIYICSVSYEYDYSSIYDLIYEYILPVLPSEAVNELDIVDSLTLEDYQKLSVSQWIIQNYADKISDEDKQIVDMDDIFSQITNILLSVDIINIGEDSSLIKNLKEHIYPYYIKGIKR